MKTHIKAIALCTCLSVAGASNAGIIDFSSQGLDTILGSVSDVTFDQPGTHSGQAGFRVINNGGTAGNYVFNSFGEDFLGFTFDNAVTLNSLDITRDPLCCGGSGNASVEILLYDTFNSLLSSTSVTGGTNWQTIVFGQQDVSRVVFDVASYYNPYDNHSGDHDWFGLDNIVYDNKISSVPEPSSLVLLGLGVVGLGLSRRKKAA